jgi:hypothetical protein
MHGCGFSSGGIILHQFAITRANAASTLALANTNVMIEC